MSLFVDFLSIASVFGIWPRFIEPKLLSTTEITWDLEQGQRHLENVTIAHISDLHFHKKVSNKFLDKIARRLMAFSPDLVFFTGDFICYSELEEEASLKAFLQKIEAPLGCYAIFGNHDYSNYVSLNRDGIYGILPPPNPLRGVMRGLQTIFSSPLTGYRLSPEVQRITFHERLISLLTETSFQLLENKTITLPIGLNITGLGDIALGRCLPETAFTNYNPDYPGIILSHNPDSFPLLLDYPGNWILSGHTHGEQIHFPWPKWLNKVSQKLARLENREYTRGLFTVGDKKMYVNRGLGCHKPFRFCSLPEITIIKTL